MQIAVINSIFMSYYENRISDQIEQGFQTEQELHKWIEQEKWQFIPPLKIFQHPKKEIYKTYEELKQIYLDIILG